MSIDAFCIQCLNKQKIEKNNQVDFRHFNSTSVVYFRWAFIARENSWNLFSDEVFWMFSAIARENSNASDVQDRIVSVRPKW